MSTSKKKLKFEEALKQLEQIADEIEQGRIGLEESITKYEDGMSLIRHCRAILDRSELKIQKLQDQADQSQESSARSSETDDTPNNGE